MNLILKSLAVLLVLVLAVNYWVFLGDQSFQGWNSYLESLLSLNVVIEQTCDNCFGAGETDCEEGGGAGFGTVRELPCESCDGTGVFERAMSRDQVSCPFCGGSGLGTGGRADRCTVCAGRGSRLCATCDGEGSIDVQKSKWQLMREDLGSLVSVFGFRGDEDPEP